jgi:hypothetical protein
MVLLCDRTLAGPKVPILGRLSPLDQAPEQPHPLDQVAVSEKMFGDPVLGPAPELRGLLGVVEQAVQGSAEALEIRGRREQ